jgi:predicted amidohydrolase YtcJ
MFANLVLKSDAVFTGDGSQPFAGGVAIADGKVVACGDDAAIEPFVGPETEVREYGDKLIMPGFNDSHTHFPQGALMADTDFCINVGATDSLDDCLQKMREYADAHPDNEWVYGMGVLQFLWDDPTMPTAAQIDAVIPDRPVALTQVDMHTWSANTMAMEKAGITRDTPDPFGGEILRDAEGNPTGVFSNTAGDFFAKPIFHPEWEQLKSSYRKAFETTKSLGLTTISCVYPEGVYYDDPYEVFAELDRDGELPFRLPFYTALMGDDIIDRIRSLQGKYNVPGSKVTCNGFKILIDGVCSDHTAWMAYPYANDASTNGQPAMDLDQVRKNAFEAIEEGYPVRIHTIGDRAVNWALDMHEEARRLYGDKALRHVQEHLETVQPDDLPRFAELGIVGCMQPMHMLLDLEYRAKDEAVGPERLPYCWPFRSLLDAGATIALSTDFPVVELDPLHEVYAAVTRQLFDGTPEAGWVPEQRITLAEALKAYTYGSAYCEGMEDEVGTLEPGKAADVIVLSKNLFEVEPAEYLDTKVKLTVFDGNVVYEA